MDIILWILVIGIILIGLPVSGYLYTGRKYKAPKEIIYQEPFTFLDTHEKAKRNFQLHQEWQADYNNSLNDKDKLIAEGYVPGTISTHEARLLEGLYKQDKGAFYKYLNSLNTRARLYQFGSQEHLMLEDIERIYKEKGYSNG